jgi:hypothetical protein
MEKAEPLCIQEIPVAVQVIPQTNSSNPSSSQTVTISDFLTSTLKHHFQADLQEFKFKCDDLYDCSLLQGHPQGLET